VPLRQALLAVFLLLGACGDAPGPGDDPRANPRDSAKVALGANVYGQQCAACHGANLEGQPNWKEKLPNARRPAPPHDDSGHTWHHADHVLFAIVKKGLVPPYASPGYESDMPAFAGKLSDDEMWAVLAFIKSHWSREVFSYRAEMTGNASGK
jgi:mono/diheme cytochrome c family protein